MAVAVTAGYQSVAEPSRIPLLILATTAGVVLLVLAYVRFEAFVLLVLAIRASVDWTKAPTEIGEPTRSGVLTTALALLFLGAAIVWLMVQFQSGRRVPFSPLSLAWLAFLGATIVSAVAAQFPIESLAEAGRIATVVAMLLVLQQMLGDGLAVRRVLTACYVSAIVPLLVAAQQALASGGSALEDVSRVQGTFAHPNALGFYLVILTVMGIALLPHVASRTRALLLPLLWGSTVIIILTYSRGSWFALILGLIVVGLLQARRLVFVIVAAAAALALTVPPITARFADLEAGQRVAGVHGNSLAWRLDYWSSLLALANDDPLIGIGPKMTQYVTDEAKLVHNDYLRAYVETGVLGLTAYALVIVTLISTARGAIRRAAPGFDRGIAVGFCGCLAAFLLFSLGENVMSQVVVLWYFVAFAAAAIAVSRSPSVMGERVQASAESVEGADPPLAPQLGSPRTGG